jgi:hypothetical protein
MVAINRTTPVQLVPNTLSVKRTQQLQLFSFKIISGENKNQQQRYMRATTIHADIVIVLAQPT